MPLRAGASEHLTFQQAIPGRPQDVRRALTRIVRALAAQGLSGEGCLRAEVVLAEILNNVVEHGYGDGAPGSLTVRIERSEAGFRFRVQDDGAPMPNRAIPLGRRHDLSVGLKNLPEGGFGWCLIRELTAELRYERQHGRNTLSFRLSDRVEI